MQTSSLKEKNNSESGFSLLEILVALTLGAMLYGLFATTNNDARDHLSQTINDFERAIRFSIDESTLRNSIIRLHFNLDKDPQKWSVQYGPNDKFVLPNKKIEKREALGISDQENLDKETKSLNKKFNRVAEFSDGDRELSPIVKVLGIGTSLSEALITEFEHNIYVYPTGEKDSAIIILATDEEVGVLKIDPFTLEFEREYKPLNTDGKTIDQIERQKYQIAKEVFEDWYKQ